VILLDVDRILTAQQQKAVEEARDAT